MKQIKEAGFLYAHDILLDGKSSGVAELPIERILDDAPYFGAASGPLPSPELAEKIFPDEFDLTKPGVWFATHEDAARFVKTAPARWSDFPVTTNDSIRRGAPARPAARTGRSGSAVSVRSLGPSATTRPSRMRRTQAVARLIQ